MKLNMNALGVGLLAARLSAAFGVPAQAAAAPSIVLTITDSTDSSLCTLALVAKGLQPQTGYEAWAGDGGVSFVTDAKGNAKGSTEGIRSYFNKTVATEIIRVDTSGSDPVPTNLRARLQNRCPA